MEARLFFISLWCGLYGYLLRLTMNREEFIKKPATLLVINSLFWATGAAMLGMLLASYSEKIDQTEKYSLIFAGVGLIAGAFSGFFQAKNDERRTRLLDDNLEWADTGFSAILLASVVMFFVVQAFKIPSGSMRLTFVEGDHLFVNKFKFGVPVPFSHKKLTPFKDKKWSPIRSIRQGDIVIFRFPAKSRDSEHRGKDFIKRVVALEGQTVQIKSKEVYVDGAKLLEPYKQHVDPFIFPPSGLDPAEFQSQWESGRFIGNDIRDNFGPVVVPPNHLMVMGDNRDRSYDSRYWGPLPIKMVKGIAWFKYWGPIDPEELEKNHWLRYWPPARMKVIH